MLVVLRFRVAPDGVQEFRRRAAGAVEIISACPGWRSARIARAVDDPELWAVATEWDGVGDYRRALSSFEVKLGAVPFLSTALDEPTAYEVVEALGLGTEGLPTGSGLAEGPPHARW